MIYVEGVSFTDIAQKCRAIMADRGGRWMIQATDERVVRMYPATFKRTKRIASMWREWMTKEVTSETPVNEIKKMIKAAKKSGESQSGNSIATRERLTSPGRIKLNAEQVLRVRKNVSGWSERQWAKELDVHENTIRKINKRETWAHVA